MILLMCLIFLVFIFTLPFTYIFIIKPDKKNNLLKVDYLPQISIIVPVHNEEKNIKRKMNELISINYPKNDFEIIIVDDFSDDNTRNICKSFYNKINYIRLDKRSGKIGALNKGIYNASNDIIVITDADTKLNSNSIKKLVRNFIDPRIGAVNGTLKILKGKKWISQIEDAYVNQINKFLISASSRGAVVFLYGQLAAFRKSIVKRIKPDAAVDDIEIALNILNKGKRVIQEPAAIVYEEVPSNFNQLLRNKIRRTVCSIEVIFRYLRLLNPKSGFISLTLLSYRIIPIFSPLLLLGIITISFVLSYLTLYIILFFVFISLLLRPRFLIHFIIMQPIVIISWFAFFFGRIPIGASWRNKE